MNHRTWLFVRFFVFHLNCTWILVNIYFRVYRFRNWLVHSVDHHKFLVYLHDLRTMPKYGEYDKWSQVHDKEFFFSLCRWQGKSISKALHTPSNYQDRNYQRFIRIFSLQIRKQPIKLKMKQMFCFNFALLKSVSIYLYSERLITKNTRFLPLLLLISMSFVYFLPLKTIVLITTYVAIVIQFQISEENVPPQLKQVKLGN